MKRLKVAIMWHQHQPYYKYKGEFLLPWVRLHGVKDYYDLPALLNEFPKVKQTFNVVPSLMLQINDYLSKDNPVNDKIQQLTSLKAKLLTDTEKREILNCFFIINYENLIKPYTRFNELYEQSRDTEKTIAEFKTNDWLDLQVWYNLAWIGQVSRQAPFIQRLFIKMRNFTEEEKNALLEFHNNILERIVPEMRMLHNLGQIEISCSPMYHPILPLLCNSASVLEATPNATLPNPLYKYPQDANEQIKKGIEYYKKLFNVEPQGMWPSEGAISNETLNLIAKNNILWCATDEGILSASLKDEYKATYKYFPFDLETENGTLTMFFRDHSLSDKIGFLYSNWNGYDASMDFRNALYNIRDEIVNAHGEDALDSAVVPIILDGENCWEFYFENGIYFLRDFFKMLSEDNGLETVLFNECLNFVRPEFLPILKDIRAGSWINSNFNIWAGDKDDIKAWNLLSKVRQLIETQNLTNKEKEAIMEEIYIAEGSDWFWWYGPEHNAPNKPDFDVMFRWHITEIYKKLNILPPHELDTAIISECSNNATYSTMHKYGS